MSFIRILLIATGLFFDLNFSRAFARTLYASVCGFDYTAVPDDSDNPFTLAGAFKELHNGDSLVITAGTYLVAPGYPSVSGFFEDPAPLQLTGLSDITIKGEVDTEIYGEGRGDFLAIQDCSNVRIEGLTFRGNRPGVKQMVDEFPIYSTIHFRRSNTKVVISGCEFIDFGDQAISHLFAPHQSYDVTVENCYFLNGGDFLAEVPNYINSGDGSAISGPGPGWKMIGNLVENCFNAFEIEGAWDFPITNILIKDNLVKNCAGGVAIWTTGEGATPKSYSQIRIENNLFSDFNPHEGLWVWGIWVGGGDDIQITGNRFSGIPAGAITLSSEIMGVNNVRIDHNTVTSVIYGTIVNQVNGNPITDIRVENNIYTTVGTAVWLNGGKVAVRNNNICEFGGYDSTRSGIEALCADSSDHNILIEGNILIATELMQPTFGIEVHPSATHSLLVANQFSGMLRNQIKCADQSQSRSKIVLGENNTSASSLMVFGTPLHGYLLQTTTDFQTWIDAFEIAIPETGVTTLEFPSYTPGFFRLADMGD